MIVENALAHYYSQVQNALHQLAANSRLAAADGFSPGSQLPELTPSVVNYLSASALGYAAMGDYHERKITLLDLTRNPATGTTKTFASLIIVARAVEFIRNTGQRITIVTPSSANKAVALRDAVLRALKCGLVEADQLNIVTIVPAGSVHKLRSSELSTDRDLRLRNPVAVYDGATPGTVKVIAQNAVDNYRSHLEATAKTNIWYSLKIDNYLCADVIRAFAEHDFFPPEPDSTRFHAHSVSSAFGLLGHAYGWELLDRTEVCPKSGYFLVQHLGAPDMVLDLYRDHPDGFGASPAYSHDPTMGVYRQSENSHFPQVTLDPWEVLDPTFYTRNPPTMARMTDLIRTQGGGGIVVSLAECLQRFGQVRSLLSDAGIALPAHPSLIQEWSLVMAVTGVLNAIDRGLAEADEIVVHGSGLYTRTDYEPIGLRDLHRTDSDSDLRDLIAKASVL